MPKLNWYYLSFAATTHSLGGAYIQAHNFIAAVLLVSSLGINPGGEVLGIGPIPEEELDKHVPPEDRKRLLTPDELRTKHGGSIRLGDATEEQLDMIGLTKGYLLK